MIGLHRSLRSGDDGGVGVPLKRRDRANHSHRRRELATGTDKREFNLRRAKMTESQWLKAADGDAMLAVAQDRLSPRKWVFLACGIVRRVGELLPESWERDALRFRESHPDETLPMTDSDHWMRILAEAVPGAIAAAEERQREIVIACDPDADRAGYQEIASRRINPAVPLFRAASGSAADAIWSAGQAARYATQAVERLVAADATLRLPYVRRLVVDAMVSQATAGLDAALALEFKSMGDAMADLGLVKNPRLKQAEAETTVQRTVEASAHRSGALADQKSRADCKALAKLLLEQLGNPFRPYRFNARWRTEAVVGIARAIDEDRAVERYPILLDALLDADCDEEAILRHVRGTEAHDPYPTHAVGCWVLDLILQKDEPLYARPPLKSTKSGSGPGMQLGLAEGPIA